MLSLSLIVPVFNEAGNLLSLARELDELDLDVPEIVWVENGSSDNSGIELARVASLYPRSRVLRLPRNQGYGGGIRAGVLAANPESTHLGWIPADGQISVQGLSRVWNACHGEPEAVHKGLRVRRSDGFSARLVSKIYSSFAAAALGIDARDTNGLPKIFPASVLRGASHLLDANAGFAWDAQTLAFAERSGLAIREHEVGLHLRKHGKSSWSKARLRTYFEVGREVFRFRARIQGGLHVESLE